MRLSSALKTDIRFQLKQGIYAIYLIVTFFYLVVISALPETLHSIIVPFMVFSDPSIVGFFFIGGVIMLEKTQGIFTYLSITPLRLSEYILSKLLSYSFLAEIAGFAIVITVYENPVNWPVLFIGILLTSVFFTLLGFLAVTNCKTMNQYFLRMVPYILIGVLPCLGMLKSSTSLLHIFPSLTALELVYGAFHTLDITKIIVYSAYTLFIDIILYFIVYKIFNKSIQV